MRRFLFLSLLVLCSSTMGMSVFAQDSRAFADDLEAKLQALAEEPAAETVETVQGKSPPPVIEEKKERPTIIREIDIRGNQIVSTNTIMGKMRSRKGRRLVQATVNEDLKRLYATGYFQDIKMEVEEVPDGFKLVVGVIEKPIVRQIIIEGFSIFKEEKLRKALKIIEGQILDRKAVKEGVEEIRKLYSGKGFKFVNIDSEVDINRETKEATIYIRIVEGEKYRIRAIAFEGVRAFEPKKLKKLMKTKKKGWLFRSGVFKQKVFQKDLERIRLYYQQEGYLDVKVVPGFDYDDEARSIFITISVEEGQHYITGDIKIDGNRLFPESEIWEQLEMLPGLTYSQFYLSQDIERIRDFYHEQGYMDARIIPDIRLNRDTGKVDILYQVQEGDMYFVGKVVVRGNTKTRDIVIRRELRIRPGEKFDGSKIRKSKQRLENLGFFEEVTYDAEPSQLASNRKDLIFRVKEKRTGELSFGGGVSSVDQFVGFAEISQRNFDLLNWPRFTGGGQSLSVRVRIGSVSQNFNVSFVEPYVFNKPYSFGIDLFNTRRNDKNVDFEEERRGFNLTLSRLFRDVLRMGTGYTLERVEIDDVSDDAPRTVRAFEGKNTLSRWKFFNVYDSRDNIFRPSKGILATLSGELIGSFLGGDENFYVLQSSVTKYWTIFKKHIIEARLRLGTSKEFGDSKEVPVFDRFYAGGLGTVRGYNFRRVGPIESGDAVGGQTLVVANLEYTFPIPKLDAFRGAFFIDAGHVNRDSYKLEFSDFAVSIGPGVKIKTPIGPVAFYYGFPIANKDDKDENGRFEFSLSRGF